MVDGELTASERNRLTDFARAMVDRAREAGLASSVEEAEFSLSFREELDPKAVVELLSTYQRFFDKLRLHLTHELDAVLLTVERLEVELTTLRGEVHGLREERIQILSRLKQTEESLDLAAEEFTRQISAQVARLTDQFTSYVEDLGRAEIRVDHAPVNPRGDQTQHSRGDIPGSGERCSDIPRDAGPDEVHQVPTITDIDTGLASAQTAKRRPTGLRRLLNGWGMRKSAPLKRAVVRGDRARDVRDWDTAAHHYKKALHHQPNNTPIWVQYGHALKESGKKTEAETAYQRSIELDPNVADTHLQLGHVLKIQGKLGAAAAAYLRARALDPSLRDATTELISLGWTESRIQRALQFRD
jgi:tetratricopeptide (TPR) repeat protein